MVDQALLALDGGVHRPSQVSLCVATERGNLPAGEAGKLVSRLVGR